jgi:ABC-type multidrug transport system permease subunit
MDTNPTRQRRIRWAIRGALVLAAIAIVLGGLFNVLIAFALGTVPPDSGPGFWALFLLRSSLAWGGGALFFGAPLGFFASMIWRDDAA